MSAAWIDEIRTIYAGVAVPTIVSKLTKHGLRSRLFEHVRPTVTGPSCRFIGEAFTVRTIPAREDLRDSIASGAQRNPHREALTHIGNDQVLIFDARGVNTVSLLGDIIARALLQRGVVGVLTDGGVGDPFAIDALGLPVWHAGIAPVPGSNRVQVADWQVPIGCAGISVFPGDLIVADENGIVCVPREWAQQIGQEAAAQEHLETFLIAELEAGAPLETTYPPDADTMARYRAWSESQLAP